MQECRNVVEEAAAGGPLQDSHKFRTHAIEPAAVMSAAFNRVKQEDVVGSSTACVGLFDGIRHQLHFSNLGDSGIIVLRHIDSDIAGALKRDRTKSRLERNSDLQVTFVSQQQLRSFNHPYQLGWTGEEIPESEMTSFKTAKDSCTSSIHLRRGDIVIAATDGLFDNVDVDEICEIALEWEQRHGFVRGGDIVFRERRWAMGNSLTSLSAEVVSELADALCQRARENSLNPEIDSPFAILAKEKYVVSLLSFCPHLLHKVAHYVSIYLTCIPRVLW
jgi:protein phosphatase PTC7